ncbi:hypothetical protein [Micromonospora echinospora]|uniref:hypothetical protein n=1 Tax=Micromonospora echinospora TaxID=1877 RepID=UPI003A8B85D6
MRSPVPPNAVPPPRVAPSGSRPPSTATRHLCAGAYLDDGFRRACLNQVYHQRQRLVAPSYGFDLPLVLWHCLQARRLAVTRDAMVLGGLTIAVCMAPLGLGFIVAVLIALYLASSTWRISRETAQELRRGRSASVGLIIGRTMLVALRLAGVLVLLSLAGFYTTVVSVFAGGGSSGSAAGVFTSLFGALLFVFGPPLLASLMRQSQIDQFAPGRQARPPEPVPARLAEIRRLASGNTVVFAGYRPFVGSGSALRNWGFAQRLVRASGPLAGPVPEAEREFRDAPFTAADLVAHLRADLTALATEQEPERHLPGLTVTDRIFLAGTEVAHLEPHTPPERMDDIVRNPTAPARHYLACQVVSWGGELVTTVYVHVAVQARSLYVEFISTALPPCDERFRTVDQVDGTGPTAYLRAAVHGLLDTPGTIVRAPLELLQVAVDGLVHSSWWRPTGSPRPGYDYGAKVSVRELGTASDNRNHIQAQEIDKYQRIIERRLLAAMLDFLESREVDTSEYRQRAMTLLNAGAVVSGGSLTVQGNVTSTQTNIGQFGEGGHR